MSKKTHPRAAPSNRPLLQLRGSMRSLQREAEKLLKRTQKQASTVITRDQKKALERLLGQAKKLRKDFEKRAQLAGKEIETRSERLFAGLEKEVGKRLGTLLKRLDLPSRHDVQRLSRRLTELEKNLKARGPAGSIEPGTPAATEASHPGGDLGRS